MATIKTAISIEKSIYEQMNTLAEQSQISRSRLYALAAAEFILKNRNVELLKSLNSAYGDLPEEEPIMVKMKSTHYKIIKDQW